MGLPLPTNRPEILDEDLGGIIMRKFISRKNLNKKCGLLFMKLAHHDILPNTTYGYKGIINMTMEELLVHWDELVIIAKEHRISVQ